MEKVYRLMHNNLERGPFSIDELLQQNIQPSDLIWEEGKKKWQFASQVIELNSLQSKRNFKHEPFQKAPATTPESLHPSSRETAQERDHFFTDKEEFELRAQELKKDVAMYSPSYTAFPIGGGVRTGRPPSHHAFDKIDLVIHKTERTKYHSQFLLACLVFFVFIYGWYKGAILNRKAQHEDIAARPLIIPASTEVPKETPQANNTIALNPTFDLQNEETEPKPVRKQKTTLKKPTRPSVRKKPAEEAQQPLSQPSVSSLETTEVAASIQEPLEVYEPPPVTVERKKTIGQAIKGLFKKKNKKVDTAMGE